MAQISVIVPVYKVEPYIKRCVDSILSQTFFDFELILIDDGSPDDCGRICDQYASIDNRIIVIHQKNSGLSAARNTGISWMFRNSDSKYLAFIDSDDWVANNYLEVLYKGCQLCDVASVESRQEYNYIEPTHNQVISSQAIEVSYEIFSPQNYLKCHSLPTVAWGKLFRRDMFKSNCFPVGKIHEDEFIIPKLLFSCQRIASSGMKLYYYFQRNDSITGSAYSERNLDVIEALKEQQKMLVDMKQYDLIRGIKISMCEHYSRAILVLKRREYLYNLRSLLNELQLPVLRYQNLYKVAYPFRTQWLLPIIKVLCGIVSGRTFSIFKRIYDKLGHK